jgi:ribosomal 50S subunit-recycling heat shock protein
MRVDLALKYLCLAKSRSQVKALCDKKAVWVNDRLSKPSSTLHIDDRVRIETPTQTLTISLLSIPEKQLSKTAAPAYYRVIERSRDE